MTAAAEVSSIVTSESTEHEGKLVMSYEQFAKSRRLCHEKYGDLYDQCFWPRVFLSLPLVPQAQGDGDQKVACVETNCVVKYIKEYSRIQIARKELAALSKGKKLQHADLLVYTSRKVKPLYALRAGNREELAAACRLASYKFTFYHSKRSGCDTEDVALGETAWELDRAAESLTSGRQEEGNWFSEQVIFNLLSAFRNSAGDVEGTLGSEEFSQLSTFANLSPSFVQRIFQRTNVGGQMDLEDFAKFVLAWNDRGSRQGVNYLFRILDEKDLGFLTCADIRSLISETVDLLSKQYPADWYEGMANDVVTEIWDMVHPAEQARITKADILRSNNGAEVLGLMADAEEMHCHEHREEDR